jgi:hypothetical protein
MRPRLTVQSEDQCEAGLACCARRKPSLHDLAGHLPPADSGALGGNRQGAGRGLEQSGLRRQTWGVIGTRERDEGVGYDVLLQVGASDRIARRCARCGAREASRSEPASRRTSRHFRAGTARARLRNLSSSRRVAAGQERSWTSSSATAISECAGAPSRKYR